jgi:hypothetical protein
MSSKKPTITVNRSAVTGKFVTEKYAESHKRTTETEHYRKTDSKSGSSKKGK